MTGTVLQTVSLGAQWPTLDPFLFCVHHDDAYPRSNGRFGPAASLEGRPIGSDFTGADGWSMYHGSSVPGFPQHPHRGFETVTYVRRGLVDHADSLGAAARYGRGDVQWLTAGSGIVHAEMFPLLDDADDNPLELFQIWVNLPAADKMVDAHFSMLWDGAIPRVVAADGGVVVTVVAGDLEGSTPPPPPPASWAADPANDVAIWHLTMATGSAWVLPAARRPDTNRVAYVFSGPGASFDGEAVGPRTGAVLRTDRDVVVDAAGETEILVLQGRPIAEPVAQYGPFVMNDRAGIEQAFRDYQRTGFGGWPWPADDPVHAADPGRFALRPDGSRETPSLVLPGA